MPDTFGTTFSKLRKDKGLTQDEVARKLNISPQAISKWENDLSYPDVALLVEIAKIFNVTVDELLGNKQEQTVYVVEKKKPISKMVLKINIVSADGDKVKVNLPLGIVKVMFENGSLCNINGINLVEKVDFKQVFSLIEEGVIGKLVELESAEGDIVEIWVEWL